MSVTSNNGIVFKKNVNLYDSFVKRYDSNYKQNYDKINDIFENVTSVIT